MEYINQNIQYIIQKKLKRENKNKSFGTKEGKKVKIKKQKYIGRKWRKKLEREKIINKSEKHTW